MARKTTTTKTPTTKTLTEAQFKTLEDIASKLMDLRISLQDLKGEDDISTIMFEVGAAANTISWCEDELDNIVDSFRGEETDDEDNF